MVVAAGAVDAVAARVQGNSDRRRSRRPPASACASCTAACGDSRPARSSPKTRSARITRVAIEVAQGERDREEGRSQARAGAGVRRELRHADDEAAARPCRRRTSRRGRRRSSTRQQGRQGVTAVNVIGEPRLRVALLRVERRLVHRAGAVHDDAELERHREGRRRHAHAKLSSASRRMGGWEVAETTRLPRRRPSGSRTRRSRCAPPSRWARAVCAISSSRRRTRC